MTISTWLLGLLTLLAAFGISFFIKQSLGATKDTTAVDSEYEDETLVETRQEDEIDTRLPPLQDLCLNCGKTVEKLGKPLLRCSQCKNAFYCDEACQKREWKRHKYNCSLFPPEGIKHAMIPMTKDLVSEVTRVDVILQDWLEKIGELTKNMNDNVEKVNGADLPEALLICELKLSPEFQYNRLPPHQIERHPFRNPLIQIARLYLIALVATHPSMEHRKLLSDKIDSVQLPSYLAALYGPKVVNMPADLSPGEYDTFAEMAPSMMVNAHQVGMAEDERGRWIALAVGLKKLWNATSVPLPAVNQ